MPRKLDAQFDGTYLICSVLMTSTMKSEPATPLMREGSPLSIVDPLSAARPAALGGTAEGFCTGASGAAARAARTGAATAVATTPVRNLRRSLRAMTSSCSLQDYSKLAHMAEPRSK